MKLICKDCSLVLTSLLVDTPQAAMEIGQKLLEHMQEKHQPRIVEVFTKAAMINSVANWVMMIQACTSFIDGRVKKQLVIQRNVILKELEGELIKEESEIEDNIADPAAAD